MLRVIIHETSVSNWTSRSGDLYQAGRIEGRWPKHLVSARPTRWKMRLRRRDRARTMENNIYLHTLVRAFVPLCTVNFVSRFCSVANNAPLLIIIAFPRRPTIGEASTIPRRQRNNGKRYYDYASPGLISAQLFGWNCEYNSRSFTSETRNALPDFHPRSIGENRGNEGIW